MIIMIIDALVLDDTRPASRGRQQETKKEPIEEDASNNRHQRRFGRSKKQESDKPVCNGDRAQQRGEVKTHATKPPELDRGYRPARVNREPRSDCKCTNGA